MKFISEKKYHAKLLLFGEFTIIDGGTALAFPIDRFFGKWSSDQKDESLLEYYNYIISKPFIDRSKIESLSQSSICFNANIPYGYGLGSSGALTAAIYDFAKKTSSNKLHTIKDNLADMEAYFHGQSSGLDPLTSYVNKPIESNQGILRTNDSLRLPPKLFLFDSEIKRNSKLMIDVFLKKKKNDDFKNILLNLNRLNETAILALSEGDDKLLCKTFSKISALQFKNFKEMIPEHIKDLWENGLSSKAYSIKLSGAGGGGYFVGLGNLDPTDKTLYLS